MFKLVVITDAHANLPALRAALRAIRAEGYDALVHTGDAIAIGPQPAECLELLLNTPRARCIVGNHERYFIDGLPDPRPRWMSAGEFEHQRWTHAQLDPGLRPVLARWPAAIEETFEGVKVALTHYGFAPGGRDFLPVIQRPTAEDLDHVFAAHDAALIFYGHDHTPADVKGRARYVNPGALGCGAQAVARYCVVTLERGRYTVEPRAVPYDDRTLWEAFERRRVPERHFIYRTFFGRQNAKMNG